ncbi:MAG: 5-formyltetrahydrofolate cyclo-ligase [Spirochaetales bacterium]|nr:MAG: 5-formyltetrahydrofolate cyclo-ligase [Spirochaetales bacterium]
MEKYRFTYQDIHRTVRSLARRIGESGYRPDVIVAIGTGGFIPARMLRTFIDLPILTVGVAYYDKDNKPTNNPRKVQWIEEAERELRGKRILLVDEVDDSRATLEYCVRELIAHGPSSIAVAVIHNKLKEKRGAMPADVVLYLSGLDIDDKWVCYPWDAQDVDEHDSLAAEEKACAKKTLRQAMKNRLAAVGEAKRAEFGVVAATAARATAIYQRASLVLTFLSMPTELDTAPLISGALADGKRVAAPRIAGNDIEFVELDSTWKSWPQDRWSIPVPPPALPALTVEAIAASASVLFAPGLAFDEDGGRLGRGKGYYDRFLSMIRMARNLDGNVPGAPFMALGYGYSFQLVPAVPRSGSDAALDGLVLA